MDKTTHLLYIGNALARHGVTPTSADRMPKLFRKEGFEVVVTSSQQNILLRIIDMLGSILRYSRSIDYVLIDVYSTKNFWYAYSCTALCRLLRLNYIPILHGGSFPQRMSRSPKMTNSILSHSFCNVSPSRYLQEAVKQKGYFAKRIPNTIPIVDYAFKKRMTLRPRLLYVRAFAGLYNPQMALHVLKKLLSKYPDAELCMVGPDKDGTLDDCKQLAEKLGIPKKVQFPGKLSRQDWHKLAENYDIFINTTNQDNTPVSVIEAMALGLPIVSTNPGGIPYLIDDGIDGLLVDIGDAERMTEKIMDLLKNPDHSVSIAHAARSKVEKFDWERVKNLWVETFCTTPSTSL